MSKNSNSNTSLLAAGLIGIGVGVLAAGVVNGIRTGSPRNNPTKDSKRRVGRRTGKEMLQKQHSMAIELSHQKEPTESSGCKICGKDLLLEPNITLECSHSYHKKCLFSGYVVQIQINNAGTFQCPMTNCQAVIPDEILDSLLSLH